MDKGILINYLNEGMSTRQIEKVCGLDHRTVSYWINKYGLNELSKYKKTPKYKFNKIDTKEKAYCLGFILGDGYISEKKIVEVSVALQDIEVIKYIQSVIGGNINKYHIFNKKQKLFPHATILKKIPDILKFIGGRNKNERHYPIIREDLEKYMLQGFFDADGCITWGHRKDKNRIWQKVSFTSQYKILEGVQTYLLKKVGISTKIKPKSNEKCFVLEFSNRKDVMKFYHHIYDNTYIVLKRKYSKFNALRLELEENGESHTMDNTVPSLQSLEGVETSGDVAIHLNNHNSIQGCKEYS